MSRWEIRVIGFGGQGIILAGEIIGRAAVLGHRKNAVLTQSYGPESRGGACSANLIISPEAILHPLVTKPQVIVAMSQEAYDKYAPELAEGGVLLVDSDLVKARRSKRRRLYTIPATHLAEELGQRVVANIVMLGFFTAITQVVSVEAMKESILSLVPKGTEELNLKAFQRGYEYGKKLAAGEETPVASDL